MSHEHDGVDWHVLALVGLWLFLLVTGALLILGIWLGDERWIQTAGVPALLTMACGMTAIFTSDGW